MERADLVSMAAGVIIVIIIAMILNPPSFNLEESKPATTPIPTAPPATPIIPASSPKPTAVPGPVRITYETDLRKLPTIHLPGNMSTFGGSDLPWKGQECRVFAYVEDSVGGVTRTFTSPSSVWRINCTTYSTVYPQYARFRMVLIDARTGTIVQGAELMFPGNIYKTVERQNQKFYLIVGCDYLDRFIITLEVPKTDG